MSAGCEVELRRQLTRLEDLRRSFDKFHAELITKEGMKRVLELEFAVDTLGSAPFVRKQHVPVPPPGKPPASCSGRWRSMPRSRGSGGNDGSDNGIGSGGGGQSRRRSSLPHASAGNLSMLGDGFGQRSLTEIMREGPTPVALEEMTVLDDVSDNTQAIALPLVVASALLLSVALVQLPALIASLGSPEVSSVGPDIRSLLLPLIPVG